jgi:hypothetical protein
MTAPRIVSMLDATREMSRSAHRWRDRAAAYYDDGRHTMARRAKLKKEECYLLKERGIIAMHRAGDLRYVGASPQGMAIYAYSDHDLACLHSCLHPAGAERVSVPGHPEVLLVPGKKQRIRICDAVATLSALPEPGVGYERSAAPRIARRPIICYECGGAGHIARYCPERWGHYDAEEDSEERYPQCMQ